MPAHQTIKQPMPIKDGFRSLFRKAPRLQRKVGNLQKRMEGC